jgi:hypothetical protein
MVVDTGGLGRMIAEGLQKRFGQYVTAAKKDEKLANIEFMNGDMRAGKIKVRKSSPLIKEWMELHMTADGFEDKVAPNHLSDAFLYAYRYCTQYLWKPATKALTAAEQEQARLDAMVERYRKAKEEEDDLTGLIYGDTIPENQLLQ